MNAIKKMMKVREIGVLIPLLILWLVTYFINHAFFSATSMIALFRSISVSVLGAIGASFVFCCGMMDVSGGSIYGLAGMMTAIAMKEWGMPVPVAILVGLLVGMIFGMVNSLIINGLDIPAFIATLGSQYIARGIVNVVSEGRSYTGFPASFNRIGEVGPLGIPWSIYISLIVAAIAAWMLKYSVFGRELMAVGGNAETARVCGINIKRVRNMAFVSNAVLCALAGILSSARLQTAQAAAGTGWEMTVIAAAIIGGVSMYGGSATIIGALLGVGIMETLTVSMTMIKVNAYWQRVVIGVVIVLAVGMDTYKRKHLSGGK